MNIPRLKDSRGNPSTTLTFVAPSVLAVMVKFLLADCFGFPAMSAGEFGAAVMLLLGPWVAREYKEKDRDAA